MESDEKNKIDIKFQQVRRRPPGKARSAQHELKNFTVYFFIFYVLKRSGKEKWLFNLRLAMEDRYIESPRGGSKLIPGVGR